MRQLDESTVMPGEDGRGRATDLEHQIASNLGAEFGRLCDDSTLRNGAGRVLLVVEAVWRGIGMHLAPSDGAEITQLDVVVNTHDSDTRNGVRAHLDPIIMDLERNAAFSAPIEIAWRIVHHPGK